MSTSFSEELAAVQSRLDSAIIAAQIVDGGFALESAEVNRQTFRPDPESKYLRGYRRRATSVRLGLGTGFERYTNTIFVQILIPREIGDVLVVPIWEAIEPSFQSNGDGLKFEAAQDLLIAGVEDASDLRHTMRESGGSHYVALGVFPYFFNRFRSLK